MKFILTMLEVLGPGREYKTVQPGEAQPTCRGCSEDTGPTYYAVYGRGARMLDVSPVNFCTRCLDRMWGQADLMARSGVEVSEYRDHEIYPKISAFYGQCKNAEDQMLRERLQSAKRVAVGE